MSDPRADGDVHAVATSIDMSRQLLDTTLKIDWDRLASGGYELAEPESPPAPWHRWVHNIVAHPLLVLWPRLGEWLHDRTEPDDWEDD